MSETAGRLILDDTLAHHTNCSIEGLAYLRDHSLGHNVWAHNVVTSYYVNRSDQFPVDIRLYYQFNRKYEQQVLDRIGAQLQAEPSLTHYRQYLARLLSYHYRQQLYRSKTQLGAELVRQAVKWDLPFSVVLFDSWFLRWPLIETIQQQHKDWVGGCPKDRLVLVQNRWVPTPGVHPDYPNQHLPTLQNRQPPLLDLHQSSADEKSQAATSADRGFL